MLIILYNSGLQAYFNPNNRQYCCLFTALLGGCQGICVGLVEPCCAVMLVAKQVFLLLDLFVQEPR